MIPVTFEAAENDPIERAVGMEFELLLQLVDVEMTIGVFVDRDHGGDRLPPRKFIGVMFEGTDEYNWPVGFRNVI